MSKLTAFISHPATTFTAGTAVGVGSTLGVQTYLAGRAASAAAAAAQAAAEASEPPTDTAGAAAEVANFASTTGSKVAVGLAVAAVIGGLGYVAIKKWGGKKKQAAVPAPVAPAPSAPAAPEAPEAQVAEAAAPAAADPTGAAAVDPVKSEEAPAQGAPSRAAGKPGSKP